VGAYAWATYQGKVLLVKQALGPNTGKWSLPGGGLDFGEDARTALVRELKEECGLVVNPAEAKLVETLSAQTTWTHDSGEVDELHWVGIIFALELSDVNMSTFCGAGDGESAGESKWFAREEIVYPELSPLFRSWVHGLSLAAQ